MIKIGDEVRVTVNKAIKIGTAVYENEIFYTVQFQNYKECFLKADIENGVVKVEII